MPTETNITHASPSDEEICRKQMERAQARWEASEEFLAEHNESFSKTQRLVHEMSVEARRVEARTKTTSQTEFERILNSCSFRPDGFGETS